MDGLDTLCLAREYRDLEGEMGVTEKSDWQVPEVPGTTGTNLLWTGYYWCGHERDEGDVSSRSRIQTMPAVRLYEDSLLHHLLLHIHHVDPLGLGDLHAVWRA